MSGPCATIATNEVAIAIRALRTYPPPAIAIHHNPSEESVILGHATWIIWAQWAQRFPSGN